MKSIVAGVRRAARVLRTAAVAAPLAALVAPMLAHAAVTSVTPTTNFNASTTNGANATITVTWTAPDNSVGPVGAFLCGELNIPEPASRFTQAPAFANCVAGTDLGNANVQFQSQGSPSSAITIIDTESPALVQQALTMATARGQPAGTRHFYLVVHFQNGSAIARYNIQEGTPQATVTPGVLNFGSVPLGSTSNAQTVTLSNPGSASLTISNVVIGPPFAQTNTCPATGVAPGASCTFSVTYTPSAVGGQSGTLQINTNATPGTSSITLQGSGAVGVPSLSPPSADFGAQTVNGAGNILSFTFSNTGAAPLTTVVPAIQGSSAFAIASNGCAATVQPNASCVIGVRFAPGTAGPQSANLVVATSAGQVRSALTGTGVPAPIGVGTLTPAAFDFGTQPIAGPGATQVFTFQNSGNGALTGIAVTLSPGTSPAYAIAGNTCTPALAAGTSCAVTVRFAPATAGAHNGGLQITSSGGTQQATLTGAGAAPGAALSPTVGNFGGQMVNGIGGTQTFTVANTGNAPLNNIAISIAPPGGAFSVANNSCGASLAPGATCAIVVRFVPTVTGPASATLNVSTSAGMQQATLSGTGTPAPVVNPSGLIINVQPGTVLASPDRDTTLNVRYTFAGNSMGADPQGPIRVCSALTVPVPPASGATATDPCSGEVFALLPATASNFQVVQNGAFRVAITEAVTVPAAVARLAYLRVRDGGSPTFYLVRTFTPTVYSIVAVRLAGNVANQPIGLTDVRLAFLKGGAEIPLTFVRRDEPVPPVIAKVMYSGSGILRGRWEVVAPGSPEPTADDLVPEAALPFERRGLQQRYPVIGRFDVYLPAVGQFAIPGPDITRIPVSAEGPYRILLRLEAQPAIGGSDPGLLSGGTAPFPLPTLRYFVGIGDVAAAGPTQRIELDPSVPVTFRRGERAELRWHDDVFGALVYRVEIDDGRSSVLSALVRPSTPSVILTHRTLGRYVMAPMLRDRIASGRHRWRVVALASDGRPIGVSPWKELRLAAGN